ncbi:type II toxin-antitoxin system RelE/ParE family toxin [Succinivibrio dextrinosolvens]
MYEVRPLTDRILFVSWVNNSYVFLHHFIKMKQKTPRKEIE